MMQSNIFRIFAPVLLLCLAGDIHAQDNQDSQPEGQSKVAAPHKESPDIKPMMSPADEQVGVTPKINTLANSADGMKMAPGVCLVVDDIVRQFCAANPDDISCQFQ